MTGNTEWWDTANEAALDFITEKTGVDRDSFRSRQIAPNYPKRVETGDYRVTVAVAGAFYVLRYRLEAGVFAKATSLVKRPFHSEEEVIRLD